jgi:Uma2 family endonuclease
MTAADLVTRISTGMEMSLPDFLALPDDIRAEIVDGVVRPMTRSDQKQRNIQSLLAYLLDGQAPPGHRVLEGEVVVLAEVPATARVPDVVVIRAEAGRTWDTNHTPAVDVALAVEIVSPTTATADRVEKPVQYALAGIPAFWRIEVDPRIEVVVHRLIEVTAGGTVQRRYEETGRFVAGHTVADETLPWVAVAVDDLGHY